MNKSALYLLLLFALLAVLDLLDAYNKHQEIVLHKNGLQFSEINRQQAVLWPQLNDVFLLEDIEKQQMLTYRVADPYSGSQAMKIVLHRSPLEQAKPQELIVEAVNGQLVFKDTLRLDYLNRKALIASADSFTGRRLLQREQEDFWWSVVDSPLVLLPLMVIAFMFLLWLIDGLAALIKRIGGKDYTFGVQSFFIAGLILFFFLATYDEKYSASWISAFLRVIIIVLPVFLLLKFVIRKYLKDKDFPDRELIKFATIFFGTLSTVLLSTYLSRWVDRSFFDASPYTGLATINAIQLMTFFAFIFACANLLNNLRKYFIELRGKEKVLNIAQKKVLKSQAEWNALQASVNPHFLYNSLNSIASLAPVDAAKTEKMALALSAFYKYTTNREEEPLCTLAAELEMINTYLDIEKIRFGDRLVYEIDCSEEAKNSFLPRFILQPIVENAIKYGYQQAHDQIHLRIQAKKEQQRLILRIFDGGLPFSETMQSGYGLRSVSKKLKLLFPQQHHLEFINEPEKQVYLMIENNLSA